MSNDTLLKVSQAAELLNTSPATIRRWLGNGTLPGLKLGKQWRVRKSDAEAMLTGHVKHTDAYNEHEESILTSDDRYLEAMGIRVTRLKD